MQFLRLLLPFLLTVLLTFNPAMAGTLSRLHEADIVNGQPANADHINAEYNQLINETNDQDTRLDSLESGTMTITGTKTFGSIPVLPATTPTSSTQAATKGYVDSVTVLPAGIAAPYMGSSAPSGWLFMDGKTIGSASSSATARANADTETLYTLLWNSTTNTELVIQDSAGSPTTRGASAAADFAANKRMPLPDTRGRSLIGQDDLGGTAANRVTSSSTNGANAVNNLGVGGAQTHTLVIGEIPSHTHDLKASTNGGSGANATRYIGSNSDWNASTDTTNTVVIQAAGGGGAHSSMDPWIAVNWIIKY